MSKTQLERVSDDNADDETGGEPVAGEKSDIARAVARLKEASFKTARDRERVPQPLFWSLFASELSSIKKKKRQNRLLTELFGSSEES